MSNPIKYSTGSESLALKKGNFYIGTGDVGKGPTSTTGYYNGITPPSGGYTIYLNKATGGPSIYTCANDTELVSLTNSIAGTSYTTANECFTYFVGQTDKMVLNRDYEGIVTDGLILTLDFGNTISYPKNGTTSYDLIDSNNGTLINGPTYSTDNGGILSFDGTDDYVRTANGTTITGNDPWTMEIFININSSESGGGRKGWMIWQGANNQSNDQLLSVGVKDNKVEVAHWANDTTYGNSPINFNNWQHIVVTYYNNIEKIYINGVNTNTKTVGPLSVTNGQWYLASRSDSNTETRLNCKVGVFRLYDKELSSTEVLQNYNAQKGRFGL